MECFTLKNKIRFDFIASGGKKINCSTQTKVTFTLFWHMKCFRWKKKNKWTQKRYIKMIEKLPFFGSLLAHFYDDTKWFNLISAAIICVIKSLVILKWMALNFSGFFWYIKHERTFFRYTSFWIKCKHIPNSHLVERNIILFGLNLILAKMQFILTLILVELKKEIKQEIKQPRIQNRIECMKRLQWISFWY